MGIDARINKNKSLLGYNEVFVSFAQNFEDVMIWRALGHIKNGFYIDIGAAEPEVDSVTKVFYDNGWNGINVEPAASPFKRLSAARKNDINLHSLVGENIGFQEFFLIGEECGLSTVLPGLADKHVAAGWSRRTVTMPVTTLATICEEHVRSEIHFLKIDAEWSELAILRGANFKRFRPWVVLFEATPIGDGPHSYIDCEAILEQEGYKYLYNDGINRYWSSEEKYSELSPSFESPPNILDNFIRASEATAEEKVSMLISKIASQELMGKQNMEEIQDKADVVMKERDAYMQELFESNRYAGFLTVERQNLIEHVRALTAELATVKRERDDLRSRAELFQRRLEAVYASTSWQFAKPVRGAKKLLAYGKKMAGGRTNA